MAGLETVIYTGMTREVSTTQRAEVPTPATQSGRHRQRYCRGAYFLLLTLLLVACLPDESNEPDPCNDNGVLFADDFSEERSCGWVLYNQGSARAEIVEGALRLSSSQPGQIWWTNPNRIFDDAVVTVTVRQASGPNDNAFGVICRYQSPENFYVFLISGDGYYAIGKYQSGSSQILYLSGNGQYQYSDIINQGAATNEIRATCSRSELGLAVNGLPLTTIEDPTFVTGDIGLAVSTFQPGTAVIEFDIVRVIAP